VRAGGLEPPSSFEHQDLNLASLPKFLHARRRSNARADPQKECRTPRLAWTRSCRRSFGVRTIRNNEEYESVLALLGKGLNDCEVARLTGIPRGTVRDWRWGKGSSAFRGTADNPYRCIRAHDFRAIPAPEYSYLLGMYLGDGCLSERPRGVFQLRISCDGKYPGIIKECCAAIESLMPGQHAYVQPLKSRAVEVSLHSKHWICLFPQHAPGRKHERHIELVPWQKDLVNQVHERFLRGLIHSDGCRVVANDRGVMSVRYHFSNRSEDIKKLFCDSLDALEIPWTRPCNKQIAIYRKAATARLDEFIGPKY
jgi:hypothetical protein